MSKWLIRIFYGIAVLMIGYTVLVTATSKRLEKYYNEEIVNLEKIDEYVDGTMTLHQVNRYLENPLYSYISNDEDYKFKINVYSFEVKDSYDVMHYGMLLYMFDIKIKDLESKLYDSEKFEEDKSLVSLQMTLRSSANNIKATVTTNMFYQDDNDNYQMHNVVYFNPIYTNIVKEGINNFEVYENDVNRTLKDIVKIELSIIDNTSGETVVFNPFAKIVASDNGETNAEFVLDNSVLTVDAFSGDVKYYEQYTSNYESHAKVVDSSRLDKYNSVVVTDLLLYGGVIIVVTFLIFFLRPIIDNVNAKKALEKKDTNDKGNAVKK